MASLTRIFSLNQIERFLFRPLFVFFTFCLVLLAIFQATGRFTMAALDLFEEEINTALNTQSISLEGLQGDWRGFNPVVRVARLVFPAGEVTGLEAELDVLESIFRSALIASLLAADEVALHVEQVEGAWRLRGMQPQAQQFDVTDLLWHSDEMRGRIMLYLQAASGQRDQLSGEVLITNRGGLHHVTAQVANPLSEETLNLSAWQRRAIWLIRDYAHGLTLEGALRVPEAISAMPALTLRVQDAHYADQAGAGTGRLRLALEGLLLAGTNAELSTGVGVSLQRRKDQWRGLVDQLDLLVNADELGLGPVYLAGHVPEPQPAGLPPGLELIGTQTPPPVFSLWVQQLNLSELGDFFVRHLGEWGPAGRWVRNLELQGTAHNLHGFFDLDEGLGYMASLSDISMQGYKGAPTVANVQGQIWGHEQAIAIQVRGDDAYLGFPDLYTDGWSLDSVGGVVKAWFGEGYLGLRGTHLRARLGETDVGGGFAITRPGEKYEQRLSLQVSGNHVDIALGKSLVPYKVPPALRDWLATGPRAGRLSDARFAMQGQVHVRPNELGRRLELMGELSGGHVEYAPDWPEVVNVSGRLHVAGVDTRVTVDSAISQQVEIQGANIVLRDNSAFVSGNLKAEADASAALEFVRGSPLQDNLSFVTPAWQGSGRLQIDANLIIPIKTDQSPALAVDLAFDGEDVSLAMPEYRMVVHDLTGSGTFSLPHHLQGQFTASVFDEPAQVQARFNDDWIFFDIDGRATPDDVYGILETEDQVPIDGAFNFASVLSIAMGGGVTNLFVESDLAGLNINLPGDFAKSAKVAEPGEINVQFLSDYQSVSWRYQDVRGWLHYGDGIERGALGVGSAPPMTAQTERAIVIAGHMPRLVLSDWVSTAGDSAVTLPLDWVIQGLKVDEFVIDELSFAGLVLSGAQRGEEVSFGFNGPTVQGRVVLPATGPMDIDLDYLQLPATNELDDVVEVADTQTEKPQIDPISTAVGESLPAARVSIGALQLGEEPFGAWRFNIEPAADTVVFSDFAADVNGVHIEDSTVTWDLAQDISSFSGRMLLDDLAETLPMWDYAPSLSTDKARVLAEVNWQGSPLNVNLVGTSGRVDFAASDGRFVEVDNSAGGLRILGLLNFTKVTKRISFDFSDIAGDGLSFEKIEAKVDLNAGELTFPRRMKVESSSGNFQVGGRVDLRSGELDNEMIVTLPVSKSLPWYGVYLALANPLAGLGVVVGERVLRKPIEQFSTAKFEVKGTLDEPEVKFVSLWDQSMREMEDPAAEPAVENAEPADDLEGENVLGAVTLEESGP